MPKIKRPVTPKTSPKNNYLNLKIIASVLLGILLLVGGYFYSNMERSSINVITEGTGLGPIPTFVPSDCSTISTFSLKDSCGNNSYQETTFSCGSKGKKYKLGGSGSCKSYTTWYSEAQSFCKSTCQQRPSLTPTPNPSSTSYPTPTPKSSYTPYPSPSIRPSFTPTPTTTSIPRPSPSPIASPKPY